MWVWYSDALIAVADSDIRMHFADIAVADSNIRMHSADIAVA